LYGFSSWADVPPHQAGLAAQTGRAQDLGRWRVPSLRNVTMTAPYMHDGSVATLEAVLDVYEAGGRGAGRESPLKSPAIQPVTLREQDRADLLAFFAALRDSAP
jgi:cytochrome c peroxidase